MLTGKARQGTFRQTSSNSKLQEQFKPGVYPTTLNPQQSAKNRAGTLTLKASPLTSYPMKAMTIEGFGGPEVFRTSSLPKPAAGKGQVLIRVAASTVNPIDYKIRSGLLKAIAPESGVLGFDVAGTIEEAGEGVSGLAPGDEVFGCTGAIRENSGALAEFQVADARLLAKKPSNLSLHDAVALPLVSITAWDALVRGTGITEGEQVLVHGATGGVGHVGIQLAKNAGAKVYATVSSKEKAAIARTLGAQPIDYNEQSVEEYVEEHTAGRGFDVVFDTVGGENLTRSLEAAALEGRVTSVNTRTTADLSLLHQKALSLHVVFMVIPILHNQPEGRARHGDILREITRRVENNEFKPLIHEQRFPFEEVGSAHALLEQGGATGKIVLTGFKSS